MLLVVTGSCLQSMIALSILYLPLCPLPCIQISGLTRGKCESKSKKGKCGKFNSNLDIFKRYESSRNFCFGTEKLICQTNPKGWMAGGWDGMNLGWIPTDEPPSQSYPNIPKIRRCSTILPTIQVWRLLLGLPLERWGCLQLASLVTPSLLHNKAHPPGLQSMKEM